MSTVKRELRHIPYTIITDKFSCVKPDIHAVAQAYEADPKEPYTTRSMDDTLSCRVCAGGNHGPNDRDLTFDPKSVVLHGACVSSHVWCDDTEDYCGPDCESGSTPIEPRANTVTADITGSATPEPVLRIPLAAADGTNTTDGTCGAGNGNTVCGDWPQGIPHIPGCFVGSAAVISDSDYNQDHVVRCMA